MGSISSVNLECNHSVWGSTDNVVMIWCRESRKRLQDFLRRWCEWQGWQSQQNVAVRLYLFSSSCMHFHTKPHACKHILYRHIHLHLCTRMLSICDKKQCALYNFLLAHTTGYRWPVILVCHLSNALLFWLESHIHKVLCQDITLGLSVDAARIFLQIISQTVAFWVHGSPETNPWKMVMSSTSQPYKLAQLPVASVW